MKRRALFEIKHCVRSLRRANPQSSPRGWCPVPRRCANTPGSPARNLRACAHAANASGAAGAAPTGPALKHPPERKPYHGVSGWGETRRDAPHLPKPRKIYACSRRRADPAGVAAAASGFAAGPLGQGRPVPTAEAAFGAHDHQRRPRAPAREGLSDRGRAGRAGTVTAATSPAVPARSHTDPLAVRSGARPTRIISSRSTRRGAACGPPQTRC